jgi:hypothetical protein
MKMIIGIIAIITITTITTTMEITATMTITIMAAGMAAAGTDKFFKEGNK